MMICQNVIELLTLRVVPTYAVPTIFNTHLIFILQCIFQLCMIDEFVTENIVFIQCLFLAFPLIHFVGRCECAFQTILDIGTEDNFHFPYYNTRECKQH